VNESIAARLAQEAEEAEARAEAEERGEELPSPVQRARRQPAEASQVYTVRIPAARLEELRAVAERLGEPPSALLRRWALERLSEELTEPSGSSKRYRELAATVCSFVDQLVREEIDLASRPAAAEATRTRVKYYDRSSAVRLGPTRRLLTDLTADDPDDREAAAASRRAEK
jgi:hypothetical protein